MAHADRAVAAAKDTRGVWPSPVPWDAQDDRGRLLASVRWFVRLRWIAVVGVLLAAWVSAGVLEIVPTPLPLYAIVLAMALFNLGVDMWSRRHPRVGVASLERLIYIQVLADLCCLTSLLHFAGGIENPFSLFYVFLIVISGILLGRRRSYVVAGAAIALFGGMILLEHTGVLDHYHLRCFPHGLGAVHRGTGGGMAPLPNETPHSSLQIPAFLAAFALTALILCYFTDVVVRALHDSLHRLQEENARSRRLQVEVVQHERNAVLAEISAFVAHDVGNLLDGTLNGLRILEDSTGDAAESKKWVRELRARVEEVPAVIRGLVEISRQKMLSREPLDLHEVVNRAVNMVGFRAQQRGIRCEVRPDPLPPILGDRIYLTMAVVNLLLNAFDAVDQGGKVTLALRVAAGDPRHVEVVCTDTGCGIAPDGLERIFEPFYSTKSGNGGTGLGLTITRRIAREHGGDVRVSSVPGQGSEFVITLPVAEEALCLAGSSS